MIFIWRLILVLSVFSENDIISDFMVMVNSVLILSGVISINLHLFLADVLIPNQSCVLSVESYHGQISFGPDYYLFSYKVLI